MIPGDTSVKWPKAEMWGWAKGFFYAVHSFLLI